MTTDEIAAEFDMLMARAGLTPDAADRALLIGDWALLRPMLERLRVPELATAEPEPAMVYPTGREQA